GAAARRVRRRAAQAGPPRAWPGSRSDLRALGALRVRADRWSTGVDVVAHEADERGGRGGDPGRAVSRRAAGLRGKLNPLVCIPLHIFSWAARNGTPWFRGTHLIDR